jgi:hypothetical protein
MGTKRQKVTRNVVKNLNEKIPEWKLAYILDGIHPDSKAVGFEIFTFIPAAWPHGEEKDSGAYELWQLHREAFLSDYIEKNPGHRPFAWWEFESPGLRKRIGGKGSPTSEVLNVVESYSFGVPDSWLSNLDISIWPKLKKHKVDFTDPPSFESQPAFLKRHNLLNEKELEKLTDEDFMPEILDDIELDD